MVEDFFFFAEISGCKCTREIILGGGRKREDDGEKGKQMLQGEVASGEPGMP